MEILKSWAIVAASLSLVACIDTGGNGEKDDTGADTDSAAGDDTDETDEPVAGPPEWDMSQWTNGWQSAVQLSCSGDGEGSVLIQLRTTNWGYPPVELYLAGTRFTAGGAYDEAHTMDETDQSAGANGYTVFERELTAKASFPNTPDTNTVFRCDAFENGGDNFDVTIAAAVRDSADAISDCIVFGHNPDALIDGTIAGLTVPSWVTDSCQNGNM